MSKAEGPSGSEADAPRRRGRPRKRPAPPRPMPPPSRAERLAEAIAEAILAGTLAPGQRLDEQALADQFGVSRTPIRDALRELAGTGLIAPRQPHMSARVRSLSPEEIAGLFVAMGEVEASCARLSAQSMTEAERAALQALHARMGGLAARDDRAAYVEANRAFHGLLYAGAHNPTLAEMAASLRRRLTPYRTAQFRLSERPSLSHAEHGRVVRAVLARDRAGANAAMLAHMSVVEEAFETHDAGQAAERSAGRAKGARAGARGEAGAVSEAKPKRV